MKVRSTLGALFTAALLGVLASTGPAAAASVTSEAFLANIRPNIDFLQRSSALAADHAGKRAVRAFAASEVQEQAAAATMAASWVRTNTLRGSVGAGADGVAFAPLADLAAAPVAATTDLVTGRSVAIEAPVAIDTSPEARHDLLPAERTDLDRLAALKGRRFDALYVGTQADALRQLSTLYASYIQNGDDPALRAMAADELPKINRRIAAIHRL